jgi:plasmid stabilization system protein ParE
MRGYCVTPRARAGFREKAAYISQDNADAARRVVARLKEVCRTTLVMFPEGGTQCEELLPGMRCFSVGSYVIFFRRRQPVEILRIVHGARDFSQLTFEA